MDSRLSDEKPVSSHGGANETTHSHYSKKVHVHQATTTRRSGQSPEIFCVTSDGRLIVFKLNSSTTIVVGDFSKFTRSLQVWVPLQCEACSLVQLMDLGDSYVDEIMTDTQSIDSGRERLYGGRFACPSCTETIRIEIKFDFYASAGRFARQTAEGARIILLAGVRDFFKSAKTSPATGYEADSKQPGSLMHFG